METKIELTDRLRREGRWKEASQFREDERVRLRIEEQLPRAEANEHSWEAVAAQYPPLPHKETDDGLDEVAPIPDEVAQLLHDLSPTDFSEDVMWIYSNIGRLSIKPETAPSFGAWGMLHWARRNESCFFGQILPRAQARLEKLAEMAEAAAAKDDGVIEEDLKRAEDMEREIRELIARGEH